MEELDSFTLSRRGEPVFSITAFAQVNDATADELIIRITDADGRSRLGEARWAVEPAPVGGYQLRLIGDPVTASLCLSGCLIQFAGDTAPSVRCLRNARTRQDARNCLAGIAPSVVGAMDCVSQCLDQ